MRGHRPRRDRRRGVRRPGRPAAHDRPGRRRRPRPRPLPDVRLRPGRGGGHRATSPSPTARCPTINIDFDESPAQEAMAEMVADDLEAVGIPTELPPAAARGVQGTSWCPATRSSSASAGSAPTARPTPTWRRCSARPPTTTSPTTAPSASTASSAGPGPATDAAKNAERWAAAETAGPRGRGRRPDRPVPHPGRGRRPGRGPRPRRRRHRRLGPGQPRRLTADRLAAPRGRRVR